MVKLKIGSVLLGVLALAGALLVPHASKAASPGLILLDSDDAAALVEETATEEDAADVAGFILLDVASEGSEDLVSPEPGAFSEPESEDDLLDEETELFTNF